MFPRLGSILLVGLSALAPIDRASAQASPDPAGELDDATWVGRQVVFDRVELENDRVEQPIRSIVQDDRGFVWVAGRFGVWRCDGVEGRRYSLPSASGLVRPNESVSAMALDRKGGLWVGTSYGVVHLPPGSDAFELRGPSATNADEILENRVADLCVDRRGRIWIVGETLRRYDPADDSVEVVDPAGLREAFGIQEGEDERLVMCVATSLTGDVWLLSGRGDLALYDVDMDAVLGFPWKASADVGGSIRGEAIDVHGDVVWVSTSVGLFRVDAAAGTVEEIRDGDRSYARDRQARATMLDRDGQLWIATFGGGLGLVESPGSVHRFHHHESSRPGCITSDSVITLLQDRSGAVWIGTAKGVVRCDARSRFRFYDLAGNQPHKGTRRVGGVHVDDDGTTWLGIGARGLGRLGPDGALEVHRPTPGGLRHSKIDAVVDAGEGRLWLGTDDGLHLFDRATRTIEQVHLHEPDDPASLGSSTVRAIVHGAPGVLWIATDRGLDRFDVATGRSRHIDLEAVLGAPPRPFLAGGLVAGEDGELFGLMIGSRVVRVDTADASVTEVRLRPADGTVLPTKRNVFGLALDGDRLLLASRAGLLACELDGSDLHLLFETSATCVQLDLAGRIWLGSTYSGLHLLDRGGALIRTFDERDGLGSDTLYMGTLHRSPRGRLHLSAGPGLLRFDPAVVTAADPPPSIELTDFRVHGESRLDALRSGEGLTLPHRDNFFSFRFVAFDYVDPERNRYAYRLDGFDADWIDAGDRNVVRYTNVDAGHYSFQVKAAGADGAWSEPRTLPITVRASLLETAWVRALVLLGVITLLAVFMGYSIALARRGRRLQTEYEERMRVEAQSKRLETQLVRARKLEAVGRLAGGVAHDFNNLMTAILGHTEIARLSTDPSGSEASLAASLDQIESATMRGAGLTQQLLMFSRGQSARPGPCDVNAFLRDTRRLLEPLVRDDVVFELDLADGLPRIRIDDAQFGQVILNLVVNANDAMTGGGALVLRTAAPSPANGDRVEVSIADTGCGMSPEDVEQIFEPFYTSKPSGEGIGLGLSTVHGIVTRADGEIEVDSHPGVGTTFVLRFPAIVDPPLPDGAARASTAEGEASGVVLLCDDDESVRGVVSTILGGAGYRVIECASAGEALEVAADQEQRIDLLLSDVIMPGMDGSELGLATRAIRPELPVLYVSGYTSDVLWRKGVEVDDIELLPKPFTPDELLQRVAGIVLESV